MQSERLKKALVFLKENGVEASGSYQKIAKRTGYNPNYISDLVNGRFAISDKFADRFQEAYSISREWLLSGTGEMVARPSSYPINGQKASPASDISNIEKYLRIEQDNAKLMHDYNEIIKTLQNRINILVDQQMALIEENAALKKRIKELE